MQRILFIPKLPGFHVHSQNTIWVTMWWNQSLRNKTMMISVWTFNIVSIKLQLKFLK